MYRRVVGRARLTRFVPPPPPAPLRVGGRARRPRAALAAALAAALSLVFVVVLLVELLVDTQRLDPRVVVVVIRLAPARRRDRGGGAVCRGGRRRASLRLLGLVVTVAHVALDATHDLVVDARLRERRLDCVVQLGEPACVVGAAESWFHVSPWQPRAQSQVAVTAW